MSSVSAIVPSYNSSATIAETLKSLIAQPEALLKEILVVDSSDDGKTPGILRSYASSRVRVIPLEQKTIPSIGRNLGAAQASSEILAFIDSDAYAAADWAERIVGAFADGCRVGGGSISLPEFQTRLPIASAQYFLQFNEFMPSGVRRRVRFAPSCNLFCERALFSSLGGFPKIRAAEDVLFGLEAGKKEVFYFDPSVRVFHIFRTEPRSFLANQRLLGKYILIYRRDKLRSPWMRGPLPLILLPGIACLKGVRILIRSAQGGGFAALGLLLQSFPYFIKGLFSWAAGFGEACLQKQGDDLSGTA